MRDQPLLWVVQRRDTQLDESCNRHPTFAACVLPGLQKPSKQHLTKPLRAHFKTLLSPRKGRPHTTFLSPYQTLLRPQKSSTQLLAAVNAFQHVFKGAHNCAAASVARTCNVSTAAVQLAIAR